MGCKHLRDISTHEVEVASPDLQYGFVWDSSLQGSDFLAYYVRSGDRLAADGSYVTAIRHLVEIPVSWQLDDFPAFDFVLAAMLGCDHRRTYWKSGAGTSTSCVGMFPRCLQSMLPFSVIARGHLFLFSSSCSIHYACRRGQVRDRDFLCHAMERGKSAWLARGNRYSTRWCSI